MAQYIFTVWGKAQNYLNWLQNRSFALAAGMQEVRDRPFGKVSFAFKQKEATTGLKSTGRRAGSLSLASVMLGSQLILHNSRAGSVQQNKIEMIHRQQEND